MLVRFALQPYPKLAQRIGAARYNVAPGTWITVMRRPLGGEAVVWDQL